MTTRTLRFSLPLVSAATLALMCACHSNGGNDRHPIRASIATPDPVPPGPAVYLRVAASDDPDDDVVPVEIVLNPGGAPVVFDAYNVEILPTDPNNPSVLRDGVQQILFDAATGSTPLGTCGSCVSTGAPCGVCVPCASCTPGTPTGPVNTPFCYSTCCSDNDSFVLQVSHVASSGCAPVTANTEIVLAVVSVLTRVPGTSRLNFRIDPSSTGDSEILLQTAEVPVTFDDRGAVFTASRQ